MQDSLLVSFAKKETSSDKPAEKPKKVPGQAEPLLLRIGLAMSGLCLLAGFFLPWLMIGSVADISGLELVIGDNLPAAQRYALAFCPLVAVLLTIAGVVGFRGSAYIGIAAGLLVFGYGLFTVAYILFTMIDVGLWLVLDRKAHV